MPITLTLHHNDGHEEELRFEDVELRAVRAQMENQDRLPIEGLQAYIRDRLVRDFGVELVRRADRDLLRSIVTHWHEGLPGMRGVVNVVRMGSVGRDIGRTTEGNSRNQTLRDALFSRRQPILLVYHHHLDAREQLREVVEETGCPFFLWTRADGWHQLMPDSGDENLSMVERNPVEAVGEALQAISNKSFPARGVVAFQDLVWDVEADNQVLATAVPTLWTRLREQEGLLVLMMPTTQIPPSWSAIFQVIHFQTGSTPTPLLDRLGHDLTALARNGEIRPITGRERETMSALYSLAQAPGAASGVLFIGPRGVGKSALKEHLATVLLSEDVGEHLHGCRLIEIDTSSLVAGSAVRGELEARVSQLIEEAAENGENIILVIDEIHTIATAADAAVLEALKEPLARGRIKLIGLTTPEDWAPVEMRQPAFASRFKKIHLNPPTLDETLAAMETHVSHLLEYHRGLTISKDDLRLIAEATTSYMANPPMPRTAITMLYELAARAEMDGFSRLTKQMVYDAITNTIGAPVGPVSDAETLVLRELPSRLSTEIMGQEKAVALVANAVIAHRVSQTRHRPTFLLMVGPTGTGKTETVRVINRVLVPGQELIEYRMEEFFDRHTGARLLGAPPGYVGHEGGSDLANRARNTPYRVVLLDEIEKAHPEVIKQLMNIILTGRYIDPRGIDADFRRWVFCATTNLISDEQILELPRPQLLEHVRRAFAQLGVPAEITGRIGVVVPYRALSLEALTLIAMRKLEHFKGEVAAERGVEVRWDIKIARHLATLAHQSGLGARNIDQNLDPLRHAEAASSLDPNLASRGFEIDIDVDGELFMRGN